MRLRDGEIKGLPVTTETGARVGKVIGMVIDGDSHAVEQYVVARSRLLPSILPRELLVHRSQVVAITDEKMVVRDSVVAEGPSETSRIPKHAPSPSPSPMTRTALSPSKGSME